MKQSVSSLPLSVVWLIGPGFLTDQTEGRFLRFSLFYAAPARKKLFC